MGIGYEVLQEAFRFATIQEVYGSASNDSILSWIRSYMPWVDDDSKAAWCGIFMGQMMKETGYGHLTPDEPQVAINWMKIGTEIAEEELQLGDLTVFWRGLTASDWRSHVGFNLGRSQKDNNFFVMYGGNQDNKIGIKLYPSSRVRKHIKIC